MQLKNQCLQCSQNEVITIMKVYVWANSDLDGAGSTILMGKVFKNIEYSGVFFGDFEENYLTWLEENSETYKKIFIIGISLSQSTLNKIDSDKVIIINDRNDGLVAKKSKIIDDESSSCVRIIYNMFKEKVEFSSNIKRLVLYIDDYNSYALTTPEAKYINGLYRKSGSSKFYSIVNRFWNGYDGLSCREKEKAEAFFKEIENDLENGTLYVKEEDGIKIIATFSDLSVNEIAGSILKAYDVDVVIVIGLRNRFVSFRKNTNSPADIKYLAENLCNGGGGEFASGGELTKRFMEYTKEFTEL